MPPPISSRRYRQKATPRASPTSTTDTRARTPARSSRACRRCASALNGSTRANGRFTRPRHNRTRMHERRLIMLGVPPETRGSIAAVVGTYRAQGLFKRWPIDYFATPLPAARRVLTAAANGMRVSVHAHISVEGFWRDAALIGVALTVRCPVLIQLHGTGFEHFYDERDGFARALVRAMLERAAGVLAPTESLKSWVRATARHANVVCLPNPVAVDALAKDPA